MPKENTLPTPDERLSDAAIAFMKHGPKSERAVDIAMERQTAMREPSASTASEEQPTSLSSKEKKPRARRTSATTAESPQPEIEPPRRPFSTRIRTDLYVRLKEVSLTRELKRQPPYHLSEIVEQAIQSWLTAAEQ
jgi:hypothetical protein